MEGKKFRKSKTEIVEMKKRQEEEKKNIKKVVSVFNHEFKGYGPNQMYHFTKTTSVTREDLLGLCWFPEHMISGMNKEGEYKVNSEDYHIAKHSIDEMTVEEYKMLLDSFLNNLTSITNKKCYENGKIEYRYLNYILVMIGDEIVTFYRENKSAYQQRQKYNRALFAMADKSYHVTIFQWYDYICKNHDSYAMLECFECNNDDSEERKEYFGSILGKRSSTPENINDMKIRKME